MEHTHNITLNATAEQVQQLGGALDQFVHKKMQLGALKLQVYLQSITCIKVCPEFI